MIRDLACFSIMSVFPGGHSLDSSATWGVFWRLLSLICWFWAVRDYVGGTSACLSPGRLHPDRVRDESGRDALPTRLVRLFVGPDD